MRCAAELRKSNAISDSQLYSSCQEEVSRTTSVSLQRKNCKVKIHDLLCWAMILHGLVQWTPSKAAMQLRELKSEEETHRTTSRRSEKNFGEGFFSFLDHFHLSPPQARLERQAEKIIKD